MTLFQIEIDAPIILRVEAESATLAVNRGDSAYAAFWTKMNEAVKELAAETNTEAHLGERYDETTVVDLDKEPQYR